MSQIAVEKIDEKRAGDPFIIDEMKALSDRIRQRAFEIFERRGGGDGFAIDDWLNAERDLILIPESELVERDGKFEAKVIVPGIDPDDVHVMVLPYALIVRGSSAHEHDESEGDVDISEFDQKTLFRRFDLPEPINLDNVTAKLEKGVLHLIAPKSMEKPAQGQSVAA